MVTNDITLSSSCLLDPQHRQTPDGASSRRPRPPCNTRAITSMGRVLAMAQAERPRVSSRMATRWSPAGAESLSASQPEAGMSRAHRQHVGDDDGLHLSGLSPGPRPCWAGAVLRIGAIQGLHEKPTAVSQNTYLHWAGVTIEESCQAWFCLSSS